MKNFKVYAQFIHLQSGLLSIFQGEHREKLVKMKKEKEYDRKDVEVEDENIEEKNKKERNNNRKMCKLF